MADFAIGVLELRWVRAGRENLHTFRSLLQDLGRFKGILGADLNVLKVSLTSDDGKKWASEEHRGTESAEGEVEEHADGIEELGQGSGIAATGDAVNQTANTPCDDHNNEVEPEVGLDNDEDDELDAILEDESCEEATVEEVAATSAEPSLASLLGHGVDAFGTTLELNISNFFN